MRSVLRILLPLVVLVLGLVAVRTLVALRPTVEPSSVDVPAPLVEVVVARSGPVRLDVIAHGTVAPRTASRLVAEVSGRVVEVSAPWVNGGFFDAGELLLRIDSIDYQLAQKEAETRVAEAELRLTQEEADAEVARRDWERLRGDAEPPPLVSREPQVAEARAKIAAARAAVEKARRDVERCRVVAPYPGRVREKLADRGEYVTAGQGLGRVYAVDFAEVRLPLPDAELAFLDLPLSYRGEELEAGPEVALLSQFAGGEFVWTGRVVRFEGEIDPGTRMVVAVVRVVDPYGTGEATQRPPLAIGMFVEATIRGAELSAFALPRSALRTGGRVLVVDGEDRLHLREVDVLRSERERLLIRGGLEDGERVVVSPLETPVQGMRVRLAEREEP